MNPKLENLQFLGVFGILKEALRLIYQWKKIFTQIYFAFILPFYLFSIIQMVIYFFFLQKTTPSTAISPQIYYYFIFLIVFSIFSIVFSLFSIATVTYAVACIYTAHDDVSFKRVISVLPKVWKRLFTTFLCVFVGTFAFNFVFVLIIVLILVILNGPSHGFSFNNNYSLAIVFVFVILLVVGSWYLSLIWILSYVVSVLEDSCGFKAMAKSRALVKGKMRMITKLLAMFALPMGGTQLVLYHLFPLTSFVGKCILGIVFVLFFAFIFMVLLVAKAVVYFVCKSYHHKSFDTSSLYEHLVQSSANYTLLKADEHDRQIEKLQVV